MRLRQPELNNSEYEADVADLLSDEVAMEVLEETGIQEIDGNLNDAGRKALNKAGAGLKQSAEVITQLLESHDPEMRFKAAKFAFERHSGRLDNTKDEGSIMPTIIIQGGQNIIAGQPSFLNPVPAQIEGK